MEAEEIGKIVERQRAWLWRLWRERHGFLSREEWV